MCCFSIQKESQSSFKIKKKNSTKSMEFESFFKKEELEELMSKSNPPWPLPYINIIYLLW